MAPATEAQKTSQKPTAARDRGRDGSTKGISNSSQQNRGGRCSEPEVPDFSKPPDAESHGWTAT
jgi:hypothetical protein